MRCETEETDINVLVQSYSYHFPGLCDVPTRVAEARTLNDKNYSTDFTIAQIYRQLGMTKYSHKYNTVVKIEIIVGVVYLLQFPQVLGFLKFYWISNSATMTQLQWLCYLTRRKLKQ